MRSQRAHARIGRVETAAALATPGVAAVLTGEDAAADGVKPITHSPMPGNPYEEMVRSGHVSLVGPASADARGLRALRGRSSRHGQAVEEPWCITPK